MRSKFYTLTNKQGFINLSNEYEQRTYLSFNKQKKEMTVISSDHQKVYTLGEILIDFITMDEDILDLYDQDRRQLIEELHLVDASAFKWDFNGVLDEFIENYLMENNISKDDFAKKIAILDLLNRFDDIHPYFSALDLYTAILPYDNTVLLTKMLDLKTLRAEITKMAEFCFDIEAEHFKKISAEKRYYFYHASGRGSIPQGFKTRVVVLPNKISPDDYRIFYQTLPKDFDVGKVWQLSSLHELKRPQEVTADTAEYLSRADLRLYEAYEVCSIADMAYLEIYQMILANTAIKKCALCGKYFVMKGDYITKYCDRRAKGKKQTCQHLGSSRDFRERKAKSPAHVEYMKAYKRNHSRIKYGMISKEKFNEWQVEAKEKTALCEQGELSVEELRVWLKN
jgi:hypothetical protein